MAYLFAYFGSVSEAALVKDKAFCLCFFLDTYKSINYYCDYDHDNDKQEPALK